MAQELEQPIADGTIKIFAGAKADVSGTALKTLSAANTTDAKYQFEDLEAGTYTYSATATDKGTVVGTFILPTADMEAAGEFTKFLRNIYLTAAVVKVTINLEDSDGAALTTGIDRVLVGGIDAIQVGSTEVWEAANVPTNNNTIVEIIPDDLEDLQNVKVVVSVTTLNNEHTVEVPAPFKVVVDVKDNNLTVLNSVSTVEIKLPHETEFISMTRGAGGSFVYIHGINGPYVIRTKAPNFKDKETFVTLTKGTTPANVVSVIMLPADSTSGPARINILCEEGLVVTGTSLGAALTEVTSITTIPPSHSGYTWERRYFIDGNVGSPVLVVARQDGFTTTTRLWLTADNPYIDGGVYTVLGTVLYRGEQAVTVYSGVFTGDRTLYLTRNSRLQ